MKSKHLHIPLNKNMLAYWSNLSDEEVRQDCLNLMRQIEQKPAPLGRPWDCQ